MDEDIVLRGSCGEVRIGADIVRRARGIQPGWLIASVIRTNSPRGLVMTSDDGLMIPDAEQRAGDLRALAEVLVDLLSERGLVVAAPQRQPHRVLSAAQVADMLGRDR